MKLRIPLCVSMLAASMLLSGCQPFIWVVACFPSRCNSPTPLLDPRTGEPLNDKAPGRSQETLEYFQMDFLGQYTVKHAFINDYHPSSKRCYLGSPIDNVQVVMNHLKNADNVPAIVVTRKGLPRVLSLRFLLIIAQSSSAGRITKGTLRRMRPKKYYG